MQSKIKFQRVLKDISLNLGKKIDWGGLFQQSNVQCM